MVSCSGHLQACKVCQALKITSGTFTACCPGISTEIGRYIAIGIFMSVHGMVLYRAYFKNQIALQILKIKNVRRPCA